MWCGTSFYPYTDLTRMCFSPITNLTSSGEKLQPNLLPRSIWHLKGPLLRLVPPGDSMDMGKGYDNMMGCATCSLSQRLMQKVLLPCFILAVSSYFRPHVCLVVDL